MPPRIQSRRVSNTLLPYVTSSSFTSISSSPSTCVLPTLSRVSQSNNNRPFSSTAAPQTRERRQMYEWLSTQGVAFKHHIPGQTNYLTRARGESESDFIRPFPNNRNFVSESILSEELRNEIYNRVVLNKQSLRAVSVELNVEMSRVAAVVRLVELEKRQKEKGKPTALPYARAIHEMVPVTPLATQGERPAYHESVNPLPVHPQTGAQIFYPVPESRSFTRVDAGRVFSAAPTMDSETAEKITHPADLAEGVIKNPSSIEWVGKGDNAHQVLQPPDTRIPHPQMIAFERDRLAMPEERRTRMEIHNERLARLEEAEQKRRERVQARRDAKITKIQPGHSRYEYHVQDVVFSKETTGKDGHGTWAPGRRYGVPKYDRKGGTVKIPTRVDV